MDDAEVVRDEQVADPQLVLQVGTDLGLVNVLEGDDLPPELNSTQLLSGRAVACLRPDSPLAARPAVTVADLRAAGLIGMRPGYVMHRYLHRLLPGEAPAFPYSADGAEMGKLMVAAGLGVTVLPSFSVLGDPLEACGVITWRPLADDQTAVHLVIQWPRAGSPPRAVRDLHRAFVQRARAVEATLAVPSFPELRPAITATHM
jgi:DNA-binding transcriptional LysR family regulator